MDSLFSTAIGPGTIESVAGQKAEFSVQTKDAFENNIQVQLSMFVRNVFVSMGI